MENNAITFEQLIDTLRNRCMYGDNYVEGKGHNFIAESWAGDHVLISAYNRVVYGAATYDRSTAEIALRQVA